MVKWGDEVKCMWRPFVKTYFGGTLYFKDSEVVRTLEYKEAHTSVLYFKEAHTLVLYFKEAHTLVLYLLKKRTL